MDANMHPWTYCRALLEEVHQRLHHHDFEDGVAEENARSA
jgi:hypothetical protein